MLFRPLFLTFIYKTKFGTIVAEVNRVAGEMVFTLVRAARGGFAEGGEEAGEEYYEEEVQEAPVEEGLPPAPGAPPCSPCITSIIGLLGIK